MGLGPLSIYVSVAQWRYAIFGLGPPSEAMHVTDGRIYCRYLAPWSTYLPHAAMQLTDRGIYCRYLAPCVRISLRG